ncbi:MAG: AMP-binding protein [Nitriliruptorales bacterium]|nr:AMP-binding protein [Nitriliruptorales bacterium]
MGPQPLRELAGKAERARHIGWTLLKAGAVPRRPDKGLRQLPQLVRWGPTVAGIFAAAAAAAPDQLGVKDDTTTLTWSQLDQRAERFAVALRRHGLGPGSRVAILARNHARFVIALVGTAKLGADVVLLNTGMSTSQAAVVLEQQEVSLVIVDAELLGKLKEADEDVPRLLCHDGAGDDLDDETRSAADRLATMDQWVRLASADDLRPPKEPGRIIIMTSGTTGAPKGAKRPSGGNLDGAAALLSLIPFRGDRTMFVVPPLFHTWGLGMLMLGAGIRTGIVLTRRFDPATTLEIAARERVDAMAVVPVMLQRILELPDDERPHVDLSALRVVAAGGSALPGPLAIRWMDAYGDNLYNMYGTTEASWASCAGPAELRRHPDTAGRVPLGTTVKILDEDGRELPTGSIGRIFVGNSLPFEGYTGQQASKEILDGLMSTGDMGYFNDEGLLFVAGRDDDMIVSGGENVFPGEVEDLLAGRDDVIEAAVVGVDDEDFGQRLAAFVVPRNPEDPPDPDDLRAFVKQHLANFSVPRDVTFIDELPRNPTGKVLKRELTS